MRLEKRPQKRGEGERREASVLPTAQLSQDRFCNGLSMPLSKETPKTGVVLWAKFKNHYHFAPDRLTGWASLSTP